MIYYRSTITEVGPEVPELLEGGVVVFYSDGAPPELAEISVLHNPAEQGEQPPRVGSLVCIGDLALEVTAVGSTAWAKVKDLGHLVLNCNGATEAHRPGEICVAQAEADELIARLKNGAMVEIAD